MILSCLVLVLASVAKKLLLVCWFCAYFEGKKSNRPLTPASKIEKEVPLSLCTVLRVQYWCVPVTALVSETKISSTRVLVLVHTYCRN